MIRYSLALAVFLLLSCACASPAAIDSQFSANRDGAISGIGRDVVENVYCSGRFRSALVHLPASYDSSEHLPLVLVLHGGGGNFNYAVKMTGMSAKADKERFIVAYPNGTGKYGWFVRTWNAGDCCGYAQKHKIDDLSFFRALIRHLAGKYSIDQSRVYLAGFSNGAMMTYQLGCELSEQIAAIAVVGGSMTGRERAPSRPLPVIIFHGSNDDHVPYEGGTGKLAKWGYPVNRQSVASAVSFWVNSDGCSPQPYETANAFGEYRRYSGGMNGSEVELYTIRGAGHSWPGGRRAWFGADSPSCEISATDKIWEFFARHERVSEQTVKLGLGSNELIAQ